MTGAPGTGDTRRLSAVATAAFVGQAVLMTAVAGLAVGRTGGPLPVSLLTGLTIGAAFAAGLVIWPAAMAEGIADAADRKVLEPPLRPEPVEGPTWSAPARLWRRVASRTALLVGWTAAACILATAVLGGRVAPFTVVATMLVLIGGAAGVIATVGGRLDGFALARHGRRPSRVPLRRRAWLHVALPVALVQAVINAALGYVLFHRDDAAPGSVLDRLTDETALADALIVVVILALLLGPMGRRWGEADAATGVVTPDGPPIDHPLGVQGLTYLAAAGLVLFRLAGFVLSDDPSLPAVMAVRGLLAAVIAFAMVGVSHVRGALNAFAAGRFLAAPAPEDRPARAAAPRPRPARGAVVTSAIPVLVVALLGVGPLLAQPGSSARAVSSFIGETEAFVLRVEYDVPFPAGTGSVAHVVGTAGPPTGENAKGLASSPSHLDPVVGGTVADVDKNTADDPLENNLPNVECYYPGEQTDVEVLFPTDFRPDLAAVPAIGSAAASCREGPSLELRSSSVAAGAPATVGSSLAPLLFGGALAAGGTVTTGADRLASSATSQTGSVSLPGVLSVESIAVASESEVTGRPGDQRTASRVSLSGVEAGGQRFSVDGDRLVIAGEAVPLTGEASSSFFAVVNRSLEGTGCALSAIGPTDRYPQGFLLARESPPVGTAEDGSFAASMAGGLMVVCDVPAPIAEPTGRYPQRFQVILGFAYTSARTVNSGFAPATAFPAPAPEPEPDDLGAAGFGRLEPAATAIAPVAAAERPSTPSAGPAALAAEVAAPVVPVLDLDAGIFGTWPVVVGAAALWLLLTHRLLRGLGLTGAGARS